MIVRITSFSQELWYHDVKSATSENGYLKLTLAGHPHQVNFWRGEPISSKVLICATEADVADMLVEERRVHATKVDEVRR